MDFVYVFRYIQHDTPGEVTIARNFFEKDGAHISPPAAAYIARDMVTIIKELHPY